MLCAALMGFNGDGVREGAHLHRSHRGQCQQNVAHTAPARVNCLHSVHTPPCVTLPYCHSVTHRSGQLQPVTRQWWTRWGATVAQCSIAGPDCGKFSGKMKIRSTYSGGEDRRIGGHFPVHNEAWQWQCCLGEVFRGQRTEVTAPGLLRSSSHVCI